MRKLTMLLLALALVGGVTVGCKKDNGGGTPAPADDSTGGDTDGGDGGSEEAK